MLKLLFGNTTHLVNFSNPLRGRKWLSTLEPHYRHGIKFLPNLSLAKDILGFTFSTNELGLRGAAEKKAPNVILGTSFAMGLSVDDGRNWYDLVLERGRWFNAAMPVGIENSKMLIDDLYEGERHTLIYLYHPNIWRLSESYNAAYQDKKTIFQKQGWKTDLLSVIKLYPRWIFKEVLKWKAGKSLYCRWGNREFHFDTAYNVFNLSVGRERFALQQIELFNELFGSFKRVVVVRVPIKEDSVCLTEKTRALKELRVGYDAMWDYFRSNDTHWNSSGNELFAERLKEILLNLQVGGVLL